MRIRRPSPATVLSVVALVMATTGTAVAAVDFARNAGAVDRLSAVSAGSSVSADKRHTISAPEAESPSMPP